jgi:hypothetical protein
MRRQPGLVIGFGIAAVLAIVVGGLGSAFVRQSDAVPTPSPSAGVAVASASPAIPSIAPAAPSVPPRRATASPKPVDRPKPSAIAAAKWRKPQRVERADCESVTAVIDGAGGRHVAAGCGGKIHYVDLDADWDPVTFKPPEARLEYDPQMAVQGDVLYLAYTRLVIPTDADTCGGPIILESIGVFVRSRSLSSGQGWSDPTRIGEVGDRLQGFRVVGGTIHATVANGDLTHVYYETVRGASVHRHEVPGASGATSLRIGDDGRARIAYESDNSLRYATFTGAGFSSKKIPGTSRGYAPVLVLGANDQPHLLWLRDSGTGAYCGDDAPPSTAGTYYSTQSGGTWRSERLAARRQVASVTVDTSSGRVHVLVSGKGGRLVYLTRIGSGTWGKRIVEPSYAGPAVIRLDQNAGDLLIAYFKDVHDKSYSYVVTKH